MGLAALSQFGDVTQDYLHNLASIGVVILRKDLAIQYCNHSFIRMLGVASSPVGCHITSFMTSETQGNLVLPTGREPVKLLWHFKTHGFSCKTQCQVYFEDGCYLVFVDKQILSSNEIISTMNSLNYEMANTSRELEKQRREFERTNELLQSEINATIARAERLASLATFAAGITHEISQPVNSIKIAADSVIYLHDNGVSIPVAEVASDMKEISLQAERINKIIRHLKGLANKSIDDVRKCELNLCVQDVIGFLIKDMTGEGITIKTEFASISPILGNATAVEELVMNLVTNGIRALRTVDKVDKRITIRTYPDNDYVILEIADNGPGIDPTVEKKIFEAFFTTAAEGTGMGLGLPIVKSIAASHKAMIDVINEYNRGVTFKIAFPVMT